MLPAVGSAGSAPAMSSAASASPVVEGASENNVQPEAADHSDWQVLPATSATEARPARARKTVTFRSEDEIQLLLAIAESSAEGASLPPGLQATSAAACASETSPAAAVQLPSANQPLSDFETYKLRLRIKTDGQGQLLCSPEQLCKEACCPFAGMSQ